MNLSFKKRIASRIMLATALIIAVVFGVVYFIVQQTVYKNIDDDLSFEANKHIFEIMVTENDIHFNNKGEWEESEHREVQVNPVFLQLIDKNGKLMDKSPNLKGNQLPFRHGLSDGDHFSIELNTNLGGNGQNRMIRQAQIPIIKNGGIQGYIVAAMSLDASLMVLKNLRYTLFLLYPIILLVLYFVSSYLAGKSISPVVVITDTANLITKNNLSERIELPQKKDELYELSSSINGLLSRLEMALNREKQFTSDASHELRTPLSIVRGTLEVLIRKERTVEEYDDRIKYSLTEIDRMAKTIDQLLELARFDSDPELNAQSSIPIDSLIKHILVLRAIQISDKNVQIDFKSTCKNEEVLVNNFHAQLILDNVISNAIKYSHKNGKIEINLQDHQDSIKCSIKDEGLGIKSEDLEQIFNPFFRSDGLGHKEIKGVGLGLAIAQKAASMIGAKLVMTSEFGVGSQLTVEFTQILRQS